eukprot:10060156-Prorocentrum_lima.AAC.1
MGIALSWRMLSSRDHPDTIRALLRQHQRNPSRSRRRAACPCAQQEIQEAAILEEASDRGRPRKHGP